MGLLDDLFGLNNATQPSGSTAQGHGGSTNMTVDEAKESYYREERFLEHTTGYFGTGKEIMSKAKASGMGPEQLKELEKRVLKQSL